MPVHDWTRVEAGIFHDFHTVWTVALRTALNEGLLPQGYYALAEQHAGRSIADVLTLHTSPEPPEPAWLPPDTGGIAVAEAPPRVRRKQTVEPAALARRRSLAIRHVSGHRLVALIEIVSPANKDRTRHVEELVDKAVSALERGVHVFWWICFRPAHTTLRAPWLHPPMSGTVRRTLRFARGGAADAGQLRRRAAGGHLPRAPGRRCLLGGDAPVSAAGPLRERAARVDLSGQLPGHARILARGPRRTVVAG